MHASCVTDAGQRRREPRWARSFFSRTEYAGKRKKTQREVFLAEMELVVPWKALLASMARGHEGAHRGGC